MSGTDQIDNLVDGLLSWIKVELEQNHLAFSGRYLYATESLSSMDSKNLSVRPLTHAIVPLDFVLDPDFVESICTKSASTSGPFAQSTIPEGSHIAFLDVSIRNVGMPTGNPRNRHYYDIDVHDFCSIYVESDLKSGDFYINGKGEPTIFETKLTVANSRSMLLQVARPNHFTRTIRATHALGSEDLAVRIIGKTNQQETV